LEDLNVKRQESNGPAEPKRWLRNGELAKYLGVSKMTLWRWKHDPDHKDLKFPPAAEINDIEFNDLDKVDAWMEARVAKVTP
jgi:predicted DNA-binding transcriptional regulator AlpA